MLSLANQSAADGDVLEFIRSRLPGFSPAERRVADTVLAAPGDVLQMSAARLAKTSGSSVGSVVRFCHTLGLPGFQDFKLRVAQQSVPDRSPVLPAIAVGDSSSYVVQKLFTNLTAALFDTARTVDAEVLDRVTEVLIDAQRILIVAAGTSSPYAAELAHRLITIGLPVSQPADAQTQQAAAQRLGRGDVCMAISHSGTTLVTLESVRTAAANGAATVALTSFASSPLSELADSVLVTGCRQGAYRSEEMASRLVHLAVLQALFVLIVRRQQGPAAESGPVRSRSRSADHSAPDSLP